MAEWVNLDAMDIAHRTPFITRILIRLFGRQFNTLASRILCRAYERQVISSHQLHVLAREFDPTQRGTVGLLVTGQTEFYRA